MSENGGSIEHTKRMLPFYFLASGLSRQELAKTFYPELSEEDGLAKVANILGNYKQGFPEGLPTLSRNDEIRTIFGRIRNVPIKLVDGDESQRRSINELIQGGEDITIEDVTGTGKPTVVEPNMKTKENSND